MDVKQTMSHEPNLKCTVIIPVYNASQYLDECIQSILHQVYINLRHVELIVYDDSSTDHSYTLLTSYQSILSNTLGQLIILHGHHGPTGVGSARNRACELATSPILVFHDADDIMHPTRLSRTLCAFDVPKYEKQVDIIGGVFDRIPIGSTPRYEAYHRNLTTQDLFAHAFRDTPLTFPTVACRTYVWKQIGGFVEGVGVPEDLHFIYRAMEHNFHMIKLQGESLTSYRFHDMMTSLSLHRRTLLSVRVDAFEKLVLILPYWQNGFSIWNSGRDGKAVFKLLSETAKQQVIAWGDIAPNKIGMLQNGKPIVHYSKLQPPIACCVALDREDGAFEQNLRSLNLRSGTDYVHLI